MEGLDAMRFETPTPVQELAIPYILDNKDLIACAQTGTGKTAAYLLPVLSKLVKWKRGAVNTVIIAPTRELAIQIDQQVQGFAYFTNTSSISIYGGGDSQTWDQQRKAVEKGADIIIATPGRLISHLNLGYVDFSQVQHLILDEADRMLDMGFYDDIMKIIGHLPEKRQNLLFSATMPPKIRSMAKEILTDPERVDIAISKPAEGVLQGAYLTYDAQKIPLINHLLKGKDIPSVLIFSSTKANCKLIFRDLRAQGFKAESIHSDLEQSERENVLINFTNRKTQILVATDILSRGIDIEDISLVINYDVPNDAEDYIHRIGRTARAASTGVGLTFINEKEQEKFQKIEELIGEPINKIPLPPHIGKGPEYNPRKFRGGGGRFKKKPFRKKRR